MGLFSNKADKICLSHTENGHTYEVKSGWKFFLYVDGVECDFGYGELNYDNGKDLKVKVKLGTNTASLFVNDVQVKHVKY